MCDSVYQKALSGDLKSVELLEDMANKGKITRRSRGERSRGHGEMPLFNLLWSVAEQGQGPRKFMFTHYVFGRSLEDAPSGEPLNTFLCVQTWKFPSSPHPYSSPYVSDMGFLPCSLLPSVAGTLPLF